MCGFGEECCDMRGLLAFFVLFLDNLLRNSKNTNLYIVRYFKEKRENRGYGQVSRM